MTKIWVQCQWLLNLMTFFLYFGFFFLNKFLKNNSEKFDFYKAKIIFIQSVT